MPPNLPVGTLAADRSEWFDGTSWQDAYISAPPGALRSPDGNQWWDGVAWRAIPGWRVRAQGTEMLRPVRRAPESTVEPGGDVAGPERERPSEPAGPGAPPA
jgi:hypothetical protein